MGQPHLHLMVTDSGRRHVLQVMTSDYNVKSHVCPCYGNNKNYWESHSEDLLHWKMTAGHVQQLRGGLSSRQERVWNRQAHSREQGLERVVHILEIISQKGDIQLVDDCLLRKEQVWRLFDMTMMLKGRKGVARMYRSHKKAIWQKTDGYLGTNTWVISYLKLWTRLTSYVQNWRTRPWTIKPQDTRNGWCLLDHVWLAMRIHTARKTAPRSCRT